MFSFMDKFKREFEAHQRVIPLIKMNANNLNKNKYSELKDDISVSSLHNLQQLAADTPLTATKNAKYESVIDLANNNNNSNQEENKTSANAASVKTNKDFKLNKKQNSRTISESLSRQNSSNTNNNNNENNFGRSKNFKKLMLQHVGYRLSTRKDLHNKRRKVADIMFILGTLGVLLMVWLIELNFSKQYEIKRKHVLENQELVQKFPIWDQSESAILLKCLISLSTIILVGLVFLYHHLDMQLYCIDNSIDDWRIAITPSRVIYIIIELIICAVHPIPGKYVVEWSNEEMTTKQFNNTTIVSIDNVTDSVPLDILLSVPMFARLYLLSRIILLHSKLVTDASSQSLGYLNRISFNFRFVFKAFMTQCPEYVLALLILILFLIASWGLKACEYHVNSEKFGFLNSMWLVAITFLTVGYGDLYPNTYCGRTISVLSGLFGVFCTALLVALISRKLEFTRAEKYVYQFVTEIELKKQLQDAAANLIQQGWLLFKIRKLNTDQNNKQKYTKNDFIRIQRKLLVSIQNIRSIKHEQRKIYDNSVTVLELYRQQQDTSLILDRLCKISEKLEKKVDQIEDKMESLEINLQSIHDMLTTSSLK